MRLINIFFSNFLFTFFHIYSYGTKQLIVGFKQTVRQYYYRIKYFKNPIKFQMWLETEMIKNNNEIISSIKEFEKVMKKPIDWSKVRN